MRERKVREEGDYSFNRYIPTYVYLTEHSSLHMQMLHCNRSWLAAAGEPQSSSCEFSV